MTSYVFSKNGLEVSDLSYEELPPFNSIAIKFNGGAPTNTAYNLPRVDSDRKRYLQPILGLDPKALFLRLLLVGMP